MKNFRNRARVRWEPIFWNYWSSHWSWIFLIAKSPYNIWEKSWDPSVLKSWPWRFHVECTFTFCNECKSCWTFFPVGSYFYWNLSTKWRNALRLDSFWNLQEDQKIVPFRTWPSSQDLSFLTYQGSSPDFLTQFTLLLPLLQKHKVTLRFRPPYLVKFNWAV